MNSIFIKSLHRSANLLYSIYISTLPLPAINEQEKPANLLLNTTRSRNQYLISVFLILIVSIDCYFLTGIIGDKVVAFLLLITLSILALFFDILPVLVAALLSALIWSYFFISPRFTFHVYFSEDFLLLIMYFVIAIVHAALTYKIRHIQKEARKKEEKANTLKMYNTLLNSLSHEYKVEHILANDIIQVEFRSGFRVQPRINLLFNKVVEDFVANKEANITSLYEKQKHLAL